MKIKLMLMACLSILGQSFAQNTGNNTANNTFTSQATLNSSCTVSANSIDFGAGNQNETLQTTNYASILCSKSIVYTLGMDAGLHGIGGRTPVRRLISANSSNTDTLSYNLFINPERTVLLGTANSNLINGIGTGDVQTIPFYATLFTAYVTPDTYSDTISITLNY